MTDQRINQPLTFKCGLTLRNRLVKAAMAEIMADRQGFPNQAFQSCYGKWADGGYGLVLTGHVQIDTRYKGAPADLAFNASLGYDKLLTAWKAWAQACNRGGTVAMVQINHPGRQSARGVGTRGLFEQPLAPSAIPLKLGDGIIPYLVRSIAFGTPREMAVAEIEHVVDGFVQTARLAVEAGFAGVQIHAAHGYLLTQFLSAKSNKRTDEYGGSPKARAKIIVDIIRAIRLAVPKEFCVGLKLNSVDHQSQEELAACIEQLKLITATGLDFLEISGGNYEAPTMFTGVVEPKEDTTKSERTRQRESFFLEFAQAIRQDIKDIPLMVTGGFRSRTAMEEALAFDGCDLIGLGRPTVITPDCAKSILLNPEVEDKDAVLPVRKFEKSRLMNLVGLGVVGTGVENIWYSGQIAKKLGV